jgi:hemin uptake protein HemP
VTEKDAMNSVTRPPEPPRTVDSRPPGKGIPFREITQGKDFVFIELDGELYRLLRTKNNKLILTK